MIPLSGYHSFKERHQRTLKRTYSFVRRSWEAKHIIDEYTKLSQLTIMLRDLAFDWYMGLDVNNPLGATQTIAYVKKLLINEF
jgi:hypothetical protein